MSVRVGGLRVGVGITCDRCMHLQLTKATVAQQPQQPRMDRIHIQALTDVSHPVSWVQSESAKFGSEM